MRPGIRVDSEPTLLPARSEAMEGSFPGVKIVGVRRRKSRRTERGTRIKEFFSLPRHLRRMEVVVHLVIYLVIINNNKVLK